MEVAMKEDPVINQQHCIQKARDEARRGGADVKKSQPEFYVD